MATADFVLIVQPRLIVVGIGCVEYPLRESLPDSSQICRVRCPGLVVLEGRNELGGRCHEAVPDIEDCIRLIGKDRLAHAQVADVLIGEDHRLLERFKILQCVRRPGQ